MGRKLFKEIALVVALILGAATATAHDFEVDGIYYKYRGNRSVKVTCKGSTYNEYAREYSGDVVIPSSVTYSGTTYSVTFIDRSAFEGCSELTSVTIPNSVTGIDYSAFAYCSGLKSVSISNSVTSIGGCAFKYCSSLTNFSIPNAVTYIGESAFDGCRSLTSVIIPDSVTSIDDNTFSGCSGLKSVSIGNSVTSIGDYAFYNCSNVTSITIPNFVTLIGEYAFQGCSALKSVTIGNSVTAIGRCAFKGCSNLTSISIPDSVKSISRNAFDGCSGLTSASIGNSVTFIGDEAFNNCSSLTSITIGKSVNTIGNDAFYVCSNLTRVDISSIEAWLGIKFGNNFSNPLIYAHNLYLNGEEVKELVIPNSVTSIRNSAFYGCSSLTSVSIPNSVTEIGNYAFNGCCELNSITIPNSVKTIGWYAFSFCSGLKSVSIPNSVTWISNGVFQHCSGLTSITIPNSVTDIGEYAFYSCSGLSSVTIPDFVTRIGDYAFNNCSNLTSVTIGNSVTRIGHYAFTRCSLLNTIYFSVENCNDSFAYSTTAFDNSYVRNIIIGKNVKMMPNYLFYNLRPERFISHSVTPPTCSAHTFGSGAYTASLYVPSEAYATYWTADRWSNFGNIFPISNTIREIKLEQGEFGLTVGGTLKLNATITPSNATLDFLFWSSDNSAAIVDQDGNVTGICEGTATITAEALDGSGVKATCRVSVKNSIVSSILIDPTELKLDINQIGTITSEILPAEATNKTVAWSTSNSGVAAFKDNNDGSISVLGVANGTATITARTTDGSDLSATCEVTVGTGAVEGVETAEARVYTTNGNIIISATEDGEAAVYDFTGRLIKRVPVAVGDNTIIPVIPGCYIVKSGATHQSVIVK